jgi:hypothetical protein
MLLAWQCGEPHADLLLERLTPEQFADVEAFADVEPLPCRRADVRAAMIALVTARAGGAKGVKLADFLPDYDAARRRREEQDPAEMDRQMMKVAAMFKG